MQAMTIEDVLKATGGTLLSGDIHQTFNDVISDSRKVTAGVLFVPLVGEKFDGHEFIKAAFDLGASAVLTQRDTELLVDKTIVTKFYNLVKSVSDNGIGKTCTDVTDSRTLFLGLFNTRIHKHRTTRTKVNGIVCHKCLL